MFTPSLANATSEERSVFSGKRFVSGRELWTLLGDDAGTISVQIAAAAPVASGGDSGSDSDRSGDSGGGGSSGDGVRGAGIRVFVGVGRRRAEGEEGGGGGGGGSIDGVGGLGGLLVGAFAAEVVLPDLNAVNGVVHGVAGVVTFPGYARPAAGVEVER